LSADHAVPPFRFVVRVRYADTDQMGMAYYGNYLRWFEVGRTEMLRARGMSYREVEAAGFRLPVLEARCTYLKPARYDDELAIETALAELGRASMRFEYRVVRVADDELLARGMTKHCFLDEAGRPVRPPEFFAALLERDAQARATGATPRRPPG
jgi:acyl-CoA thioester hydrolase